MGKQWDKTFKWYGKVFVQPQEDMPRIVKLFKKKGVKRILDLGCGSGRHTVYLAKQGFEVYGIDIVPKEIKMTRDWLKKKKLKANLAIGSIYERLPHKVKGLNLKRITTGYCGLYWRKYNFDLYRQARYIMEEDQF